MERGLQLHRRWGYANASVGRLCVTYLFQIPVIMVFVSVVVIRHVIVPRPSHHASPQAVQLLVGGTQLQPAR